MIYKHYFTFEEIQKMSYFDFKFYSQLVTNVEEQVQIAIEKSQNEAKNQV